MHLIHVHPLFMRPLNPKISAPHAPRLLHCSAGCHVVKCPNGLKKYTHLSSYRSRKKDGLNQNVEMKVLENESLGPLSWKERVGKYKINEQYRLHESLSLHNIHLRDMLVSLMGVLEDVTALQ